jgi:cytochrome c biogenesis protein CcdA
MATSSSSSSSFCFPASWAEAMKRVEEQPMVKKAWAVVFHMILAVLALILTALICGYIIYTISFIVPPYFRFMNAHGPYSFLMLLILWATALTRFLLLSPDSPLDFKWEVSMYCMSMFLMFTGVGAFVVLPFVRQNRP